MIEFIDSKRVEVEGMTVHFSEGLKAESAKEEIKKENKEQKPSSQLSKDSKPPTKWPKLKIFKFNLSILLNSSFYSLFYSQ